MTIISVGDKVFTTSLQPKTETGYHEHSVVQMDDSILKDGHIELVANPPPNDVYINCKKGTTDVFSVKTDGFVECEALLATTGIETKDDGALVSKYSNSSGILRLGRQPNIADQTVGLLDGIHHERVIDSKLEVFRQQLHPSQPKLLISGTTNAGVDWLQITDAETDEVVFGVHADGTIETSGWASVDNLHPDSHNNSIAVESQSLYIGKCKLSEEAGQLIIKRLKAEPYIPKRLTEQPYNYTVNNINANTVRSINDWMVLARSTVGLTVEEAKAIRIRDIFPVDNDADDFILNESAQPLPVTNTVYVDSSYSGTSDGSFAQPYSSLQTAMNAKIVDGETETFIFNLAEGVYTTAINMTMNSRTHCITIQGAGVDKTIIQSGQSFIDGKDTNCIFMRRFKHVEIRNLTIRNSKYGFYPRDIDKAVIDSCKFTLCGSDGTIANHNMSKTLQEMAAVWQSNSTSDGGACRIRECAELQVTNTTACYNLRGLRFQNCGSTDIVSFVSGNQIYRNLESGIYLASTNYNGSDGCINVCVSNNKVLDSFNNGLLCIGGQNNQFISNVIVGSASAGFQSWHSVNTAVINNFFFNCNRKSYNGIGNNGDAKGCIVFAGNSNIQTGHEYIGMIQGNSMLRCRPGTENSSIAIYIASAAYPQDSNKVIVDSNRTDATVKLTNDNSIQEVSTVASNITSVTDLEDVTAAGSGIIISANERAQISTNETDITTLQGQVVQSVTDLNDVTAAGSGIIISANERAQISTNETNIATLQGQVVQSVTDLNDVTAAGSGVIISANERNQITTNQTNIATNASDITALQNAGGGGGSGLTGNDVSTSTSALTKLELENTGTGGQVEFIMANLDPSGDTQDQQYRFITSTNSVDMYAAFFQNHQNKTEAKAFSVGKNGNINFHGVNQNQSSNFNSHNFFVRGTARFANSIQCDQDIYLGTNRTIKRLDANGEDLLAGGATETNRFDVVENGNISGDIQLVASDRSVMWLKQRGTLGHGGLACYKLPATADISNGHTIQFHGFSKSWCGANETLAGGSITLKTNTGQSFGDMNRYLYYDTDISGNSESLTISNVYRRTITAVWDDDDDQWWLKTDRSIDYVNFIKHFDYTSNAHETIQTPYQLPQGFRFYYVSIGEGMNAVSGTHKHVYFRPPGNAPIGTRIEVAFLMPSASNTSKLWWVDNANQDSTYNAQILTSPWFFTQTSAGRRRHLMIKVSATRWTKLRNA